MLTESLLMYQVLCKHYVNYKEEPNLFPALNDLLF